MIHNFGIVEFYPNNHTINFTVPNTIQYSLSTTKDTFTYLTDSSFSLYAYPIELTFVLENLHNSKKRFTFSCTTEEEAIYLNIYEVNPESENTSSEHLIHSVTIYKQNPPPYTDYTITLPYTGYTITININLNNPSNPHITICYEKITKEGR